MELFIALWENEIIAVDREAIDTGFLITFSIGGERRHILQLLDDKYIQS